MKLNKNDHPIQNAVRDLDCEEMIQVVGGMRKSFRQIGGLFSQATLLNPNDEVAIYVDGMYQGQGLRV